MGDFVNLYLEAMYPNRSKKALAREAGINFECFNAFVNKKYKTLRPPQEYRLCRFTGMEPDELYLDKGGGK